MRAWRHNGFSTHNGVQPRAQDADDRRQLTRYMIRPPLALEITEPDTDIRRSAWARLTYRVYYVADVCFLEQNSSITKSSNGGSWPVRNEEEINRNLSTTKTLLYLWSTHCGYTGSILIGMKCSTFARQLLIR